jgi:hypothetical protein
MAIEISNFNPVWTFVNSNTAPISNVIPQFYDGTYLFVLCSINNGTSVSVTANLYDKKPGYITGSLPSGSASGSQPPIVYNGAVTIANLNYGSIETDVQGNILLAGHEYIVSQSLIQNPTVDFTIIDLSGSI